MTALPLQAGGAGGFIGNWLQSAIGLAPSYAAAIGAAVTFVVVAVVLYVVGKAIITPLANRVMDRRGLDEHAKSPLQKVVSIGIVAVSVGVAFAFAGYGNILTALATVAAAATLAIGFAMQDVIANFVAGVFIYTDKPFRIGDWIEWDGNSGVVEDISLRVTRVRTFDNELLTVPNSNLTDGVIKNPVAKDKLRVQFEFGIGYDDDIDKATEIIVEEAEKRDDILDDPGVSVRLSELGGSYVGLKSRFWIADPSRADFVKTRGEYVQAVKERFDAEGVNIPYPTRTLEGGLTIEGEAISPEAFDAGDER
ncbi:small-conductance mechanosensitive channel [Halarchaeum solikamskense]|uniref:mechanosensitive ion channel family protein n=1 Tax=Halarchaeum nitratireducens TaxID=489913 RepID=UPI001B3AD244|nr:mechanosensitive ion channel family protein [Halarchaeum solikamskense]MBP2250774.1 small-conductance mechanosensitive channel [Halarchaeum solikamskense]